MTLLTGRRVISHFIQAASRKVVQSLRQVNIRSIDGLVTEAMLNPGLALLLLFRITLENKVSVGRP